MSDMKRQAARPDRKPAARSAHVRAGRFAATLTAILIVATATTSCAMGRDRDASDAPPGRLAGDVREDGLRVGAVPPQDLAAGECGLFLWSRATPPQMVFYASSMSQTGKVMLEDQLLELPRTAGTGQVFLGHFDQQTYLGDNREVSVTAAIEWGEEMANGRRISSAVLRIAHDSGWETLIPTGGLVGCLPT